jgi:cell division protein FtsI/penicillin-binding protein 2
MLRLKLPCSLAAVGVVCLGASGLASAQATNPELQTAVSRAMAGKNGTAVVLDVATGNVLASYRPDVAARRLAFPGSSIKTFTLLALLQSGKVNSATALICKRPLTIAGHRLDCPHPDTHHPLDPVEALAYSCNSYFTSVAIRLSPQQLHNAFIADGFASRTGLAQKEASGSVALASTPEQLQLQAIGEWGVKITPLELLRAYRNLAVLGDKNGDAELRLILSGLEGSTTYGMARLAQPESSVRVAGKTGTSRAEEGAWTHAWFAGWAPAEKPKIVVVVFFEKGTGGVDAATAARAIFAAYAQSAAVKPAEFSGRPQ